MMWDKVRLGDLGIIVTGNTPPTNNKYNYSSNDIMFFKPNDFLDEGVTSLTNSTAYVSKNAKVRLLPEGSVLTTCIGIIGKVGILPIAATCNQQINAIIPDPNIIDSRYLAYSILSQNRYLNQFVNAAVVPIINKTTFSNIKIKLPPTSVQEEVVKILDNASNMIFLRKKQLKELDNLIKAIFYNMFGDPIQNPMRWDMRPLISITIALNDGPFGSNLKTEHYRDNGIRVIRLQNIGVGEFWDKDKVYISNEHYFRLKKYTCFPGDIIIGTMGNPNLRACIIPDSLEVSINKADCIRCSLNEDVALPQYICHLLNLPRTIQMAAGLFHGQTRNRISMGQLSNLLLPVPPLNIQNQFATIVGKIEEQKALVQKALDESQLLFDALMDKFFGE